ncbi:MAG TPA: hypothetical protein VJ698_24305 [Noviherbaspirillum sp.]|uniref:hypothetical protein n=1 Tax=Noviherbaspirillum sp. TaxID=1926288 RepID=UPI002B4AA5A7|nr:hypothetical protein [Noviherbaspirillum sp.]HJV88610.1 hypothetical protein [Noviherbaspirillum sp.]
MSHIMIRDLAGSQELDRKALAAIRGGNSWLKGLGPVANVNVNVNQDITQLQKVDVNALNNVGVIGAGFGPLKLDVSPTQFANAQAIL